MVQSCRRITGRFSATGTCALSPLITNEFREPPSALLAQNVSLLSVCTQPLHTAIRYDGLQGVYPNVSNGSVPIDFSLDYHLFAVEWNETAISWFVDDVHVFTRASGQPSSLFLPPVPMYLILNTAVAYWFKVPPTWTETVFFRIDWVRIYERKASKTLEALDSV
jgi:hypothetical protein